MYKQAIQLYNKTITVLTKQEQVLSFKKIKLKTENMMNDLRLKVLSLMDSASLEAQQLTQYVGILKLMECSRDVVMDKFLTSHKRRSLQMIKQFMHERDTAKDQTTLSLSITCCSCGSDTAAAAAAAAAVTVTGVLSVTTVRAFHQSVMVGLIESSNGVSEMFSTKDKSQLSVTATTGAATGAATGAGGSAGTNTMTASMAYDELQAMIGIVLPEYIQCMTSALVGFFKSYSDAFRAHQEAMAQIAQEQMVSQLKSDLTQHETISEGEEEDEEDGEDGDEDNSNGGERDRDRASSTTREEDSEKQLKLATIRSTFKKANDDRLSWIALTRQVILHCQYLDSGTESVKPAHCDASLPHADAVAEAVLSILDSHFNTLFEGHMQFFKNEVNKVIPTFVKYANLTKELKKEVSDPESASCRSLFPHRLTLF